MSFTTPMMKQWNALKKKAKDCLLLFRLGDFYEAFLNDAHVISKELDLTLTKRQNIAMCGVPHHASEVYIDRLVDKGFKVAIAEQMQDPKDVKGIVDRQIVRVLSPAALINSNLLQEKSNNFFISISQVGKIYGLTILDLSTAEFNVVELEDEKDLINEIYKLKPKEILTSVKFKEKNEKLFEILHIDLQFLLTIKDAWYFDLEMALDVLNTHFKVNNLDCFGLKGQIASICSSGGLISYLKDDLTINLDHIKSIKAQNLSSYMILDYATEKNLEIIESFNCLNKDNTLLNLLDKTSTAMGGRLIKKWLKLPLIEIDKIQKRQDAIENLLKNFDTTIEINSNLEGIKDLQRLLIKVMNNLASPKDLYFLKESIKKVPNIKDILVNFSASLLKNCKENLKDIKPLIDLLENSLSENPPIRLSDSNIFKTGFNKELDELKDFSKNSFSWLQNYQNEIKEKTSIKTLKVKYNKIFGYFIDVSKTQADKMPKEFIRRQTLVNSERFTSEKLKEFEDKILSAEDKIKKLESRLFLELTLQVLKYSPDLKSITKSLAILDVLISFAKTAKANNYIRPEITTSNIIDIKDGRHPIIEKALSYEFIANDSYLDNDKNQLYLITGPNMAGKSTYIRQTALLVIMAQIGSFIPAAKATIGIVDRVFSRIGASDDLARGQSTFMVEMTETANILNNATNRSLIILDEIGRGTSTYDGISIAWAVVEYLLTQENKRAKTLFATHYFELTKMENLFKGVINYNIAVKESDNEVVFLRKIIKGFADKSYGIHVAKLANMPFFVIQKAKKILIDLENKSNSNPSIPKKSKNSLPKEQFLLFDIKNTLEDKFEKIYNKLKNVDLNNLTPLQAHQFLFSIKEDIKKEF